MSLDTEIAELGRAKDDGPVATARHLVAAARAPRQRPAVWRPMGELEARAVRALDGVTFLPGSFSKRLARSLRGSEEITDPLAACLWGRGGGRPWRACGREGAVMRAEPNRHERKRRATQRAREAHRRAVFWRELFLRSPRVTAAQGSVVEWAGSGEVEIVPYREEAAAAPRGADLPGFVVDVTARISKAFGVPSSWAISGENSGRLYGRPITARAYAAWHAQELARAVAEYGGKAMTGPLRAPFPWFGGMTL